jgi:hypothetical protein
MDFFHHFVEEYLKEKVTGKKKRKRRKSTILYQNVYFFATYIKK